MSVRRKKKPASRCVPSKKKKRATRKAGKATQRKKALAKKNVRQRRAKRRICLPKKKRPVLRTPSPAPIPGAAPAPGLAPAPAPVEQTSMQPPRDQPTNPPVTPIPAPPEPPLVPWPAGGTIPSPITKFGGAFTARHAERLLWRAGFGPAPGQAEKVAAMGLDAAVLSLTRPQKPTTLNGPEPTDRNGKPLQPTTQEGHDEAYWLDRMIRSSQPLVERMALVFHDWFATDSVVLGSWDKTFAQTNVFRANALGSFASLLRDITRDPAMILFLDLDRNSKEQVNENYARELMELFTLGTGSGAYSESDVREMSRALTGLWAKWSEQTGYGEFTFVPERHDAGSKTIFGKRGDFDWQDALDLVLAHPEHARFFVTKLWSYFVPDPLPPADADALAQLYVASGHQIRPLLESILTSAALYEGSTIMKPPVVYTAGVLRARQRFVTHEAWYTYTAAAGQRLYCPPDVAGWNDELWLNPDTVRGRWDIAALVLIGDLVPSSTWASFPLESPEKAVTDALDFWSFKSITQASHDLLLDFAVACDPLGTSRGNQARRVNALRQLVPSLPDYQVC